MPVAPAETVQQPSRSASVGRALTVLVRACHPEPTAAVTGISVAYALAGGAGRRSALVGAAVLAQQLSIGWSNDALDATRDRADGRADKPLAAGELSPRAVLTAATVALAVSVPLSRAAAGGAAAGSGVGNLLCAGSGWAYNVGLKATLASPLPYLVGFGGLAAFLDGSRPGAVAPSAVGAPPRSPGAGRPSLWVVAAGALLGASAHVANVLPDIDDDLAHGIAGLPQRLGALRSRQLCAGLLAAAGLVLALAPAPGPGGSRPGAAPTAAAGGPGSSIGRSLGGSPVRAGALAVPAVALAVVARRAPQGSRAAFRLVLAAAALDIGLLLRRARS